MSKCKVQAYDVSEKAKKAIKDVCDREQRSESFIISRLLNKLFDPVEGVLSPKNK